MKDAAMIDIHSHILPDVDDGAKTLDEALDMLRMAVDQGVNTQILTPHIHFGRYDNKKSQLQKAFLQFQDAVKTAKITINLRLAAELRIGPELMQLQQQDQIPWLGQHQGKKVFLLEFPRIDIPHGSDNLVRWLLQKNIMPLIVHPERNKTFINQPQKLQAFIDLGCPLQLTASSVLGKFGQDVQQSAMKMLEQDHIFAIASDCHNLRGRAPDLGTCVEYLKTYFDDQQIKNWVQHNPASLFDHQHHRALFAIES